MLSLKTARVMWKCLTQPPEPPQLAVASLVCYDVYKRYVNPDATGQQMIFVSRLMVCVWGIFSGVIACILNELGIGLGWVYGAMGNFIGSAVVPIALALMWKECNATGAIAGAMGGLLAGLVAWISVAAQQPYTMDGKCVSVVNVDTLGSLNAQLAGNLCALCVSACLAIVISLADPQNFDWDDLRSRTDALLVEDDKNVALTESGSESKEALDQAYVRTIWFAAILMFVLILLWPALSLPAGTFTRSYFGFWVAIAFIWGHAAFCVAVILPVYEYFSAKPAGYVYYMFCCWVFYEYPKEKTEERRDGEGRIIAELANEEDPHPSELQRIADLHKQFEEELREVRRADAEKMQRSVKAEVGLGRGRQGNGENEPYTRDAVPHVQEVGTPRTAARSNEQSPYPASAPSPGFAMNSMNRNKLPTFVSGMRNDMQSLEGGAGVGRSSNGGGYAGRSGQSTSSFPQLPSFNGASNPRGFQI